MAGNRFTAVFGALLSLGWAGVAHAAEPAQTPPITKLQARELPPDEVKQLVLTQLGAALVLQPYPSSSRRPQRPLDELWFSTRSYPTHVPGLCAVDQLVVRFMPAGPLNGAKTESRVSGVQSGATLYKFVVSPRSPEPAAMSAPAQLAAGAVCAKLKLSDGGFFGAGGDFLADQGVFFLNKLADERRVSGRDFPVTCPGLPEANCQLLIDSVGRDSIDDVERCTKPAPNAYDCVAVSVGYSVEVDISFRNEKIVAATLQQLVVVADEKAD